MAHDTPKPSFTVEFDTSARKQRKNLDPPIVALVDEAEKALAVQPFPDGSKIKKYRSLPDTYIYKLGDNWRLVYHLNAKARLVAVIDINKRGDVYKKFQSSRKH